MVATFVRNFLELLIVALLVLLVGRVLMSFIDPGRGSQASRFLVQATEPFLAPVRRLLPQTGMFDFSVLVAFLVLSTLLRVVQAM